MTLIPFSFVQKNLSSGVFVDEDFWFLQNIWDALSPEAQNSIFELSEISSEYMNNAIDTAYQGNTDFPTLWKEYTLQLIKKQIQDLEREDQTKENPTLLFSAL